MTTFRIRPHLSPDRAAIEVIGEGGKLLAVIYAHSDRHIRVMSKHLDRVEISTDGPPAAEIYLEPG
jgi:hypothetical protein